MGLMVQWPDPVVPAVLGREQRVVRIAITNSDWCDGYQLIVNGTISPASTVNSPIVVSSGVPCSGTGVMNWIACGPATALGPPKCCRTQGMLRP